MRAARQLRGLFRGAAMILLGLGGSDTTYAAPAYVDLLHFMYVPELAMAPVVSADVPSALLGALELAREGAVEPAIERLEQIAGGTGSPSARFAALLAQKQLILRRFEYLGGLGRNWIEAGLENPRALRHLASLDPRLVSVKAEMTGESLLLAERATAYDLFLSTCLIQGPDLVRGFRPDRMGGAVPPEMPTSTQCRMNLAMIEGVWGPILTPLQRDVLVELVEARFKEASGDQPAFRAALDRALTRAEAEGGACTAGELLLRMGDARSAPQGSPLTLGYDLSFESIVRDRLEKGLAPPEASLGSAEELAAAAAFYNRARQRLVTCENGRRLHSAVLRQAWLSWLRREPGALAAWREAAEAARAEGRPRMVLLAEATEALLRESQAGLSKVFDGFLLQGDLRGFLTVAEMAASHSLRIVYMERRLGPGEALLRTTAERLRKEGFLATAAGVAQRLATLLQIAWRLEPAASVLRDAITWQKAFLACGPGLRFAQPGCEWPAGLVAGEKLRLYALVTAHVNVLTLLSTRERTLSWLLGWNEAKAERQALAGEIAAIGMPDAPGLPRLADMTASYERLYDRFLSEADLLIRVGQRTRCESRAVLLRETLETPGSLGATLLGNLEALLAWCDAELARRVRARLENADPVDALQRARKDQIQGAVDGEQQVMLASMDLVAVLEQALRIDAAHLAQRWLDRVAGGMSRDSGLAHLHGVERLYRSRVLLAKGDPSGALTLQRELLAAIERGTQLFMVDPGAVLGDLVETAIAQDDAEGSLVAWWRWQEFQRRRFEALTGVRPASPASAELAMLERKVAGGQKLTPDQETRRMALLLEGAAAPTMDLSFIDKPLLRRAVAEFPAQTVALVYHSGRKSLAVWRLRRGEPVGLVRLPALPWQVQESAERLRGLMSGEVDGWEPVAADLYHALVEPLGPWPAGDRLAVLAAGALTDLPFDIFGPLGGPRLGERYPLLHASTLAASPRPPSAASEPALVVGWNAPGLGSAESEARQVARLLGVEPRTGARAVRSEVEPMLGSARILHFATHGTVDPDDPYRNSLSLADDEPLESWQIFQQRLDADLVVLSACNSARSKALAQDLDGSSAGGLSLAAALHASGARQVVASLWQVEDTYTEKLMVQFYEKLVVEGLDPILALHRAKVAMGATPGDLARGAAFQLFVPALLTLPPR